MFGNLPETHLEALWAASKRTPFDAEELRAASEALQRGEFKERKKPSAASRLYWRLVILWRDAVDFFKSFRLHYITGIQADGEASENPN